MQKTVISMEPSMSYSKSYDSFAGQSVPDYSSMSNISASFTDSDGKYFEGEMTVEVFARQDLDTAYIWISRDRPWDPQLDERLLVEAEGVELYKQDDSSYIITRHDIFEERSIVARLENNGAILQTVPTHCFALYENEMRVYEIFEDGSNIVGNFVIGVNLPEDLTLTLKAIASGVSFLDGSRLKSVTAADFNSTGIYQMKAMRSPTRTGAGCHRFYLYQNGVLLGDR